MINNEIQINSDAINSFEREIKKDDFRERVVTHNLIMQAFLKTLYRDLAFEDKSNHLAFKERDDFANEMGIEYFRKIGLHEYEQLLTISANSLYEIFNFKIEKKLLGKLNIQKFKFKFHCGFQYNNQFIEIYEFINSNEYFIFLKERRELFFIQLADFSNIDFSKNTSNKKEILLQLNQKNEELIEKSKRTLKVIPTEIEIVLTDYYNKIAAFEFLDDLQNIDEQTNILRTMLNIKIN